MYSNNIIYNSKNGNIFNNKLNNFTSLNSGMTKLIL